MGGVDAAEDDANGGAPALAFPEGWFQIAYGSDLERASVVPLRYFARDLVLFRTADGVPQVFDAHCVHLGAHLGHGGRVEGSCLRCPFHAWAFDLDGACVDIPYTTRIPRGARTRSWPTLERSGIVWMWFSPSDRAPSWEPPALPEFDRPDWVGYLRHRRVFRSIVQEIVENVFDTPHGQFVHENKNGTAPAEATFTFDAHTATAIFRLETPLVGGRTEHVTEVHGPAITVNHSVGHGSKAFYTTYTPIDATTVETNFSFMTPRRLDDDPTGERSLASAQATTKLFEQDIPIWEHKVYRSAPLLCDGDTAIARYRVWARQFQASFEGELTG
jgi:phenylpropionate dioxygenase-like ring-hydroxylating dioxygenase large terminal subunit